MKEYNPNKSYKWNEDDKFIVKGSTIALFNMLIRMETSTTEYKKFLIFQKAAALMQDVLGENINNLELIEDDIKGD